MSLPAEQIRLFRHNGFLKLKESLPQQQVAALKAAVDAGIKAAAEPVQRDQDGRVIRLSQILDRDPIFAEAAAAPQVVEPLAALLGPNIEAVKNRHNHATLNLARPGPLHLHRDILQWTRGLVTVIFYLEETTVENGCTHLVPGTHLLPGAQRLHNLVEEDWIGAAGLEEQALPVPMPAGGLLAIDSLVFHRAGRNKSGGSRTSLTIGYHSVDELATVNDPARLLVRGQQAYLGNDRSP